MTRAALLASVFSMLCGVSATAQQQTALQTKAPVERPLSPKDAGHEFTVTAKANQAFTIAVQQQGIDVVVTALGPDGKQVTQVDNASEENGTGGSEIAHVTALTAGEYRIRVTPFERGDAKPAKYTITLTEMRDLTGAERANAQSEKEIIELEQQWEHAVDMLDVPTLTRILREDAFAMGTTAAATRTREQVVTSWERQAQRRAKLDTVRDHTISEHTIKAAGNVAVSTLRFVITEKVKDRVVGRFSGQAVHIWAKNDAGWRLIGDYTFPFGRVLPQQTEAVKVEPGVLSAYAGTYRDEPSATTFIVTVDAGVLQGQVQNETDTNPSPKVPLKPVSNTTFTGFNPNDEVTFVRSPSGEVREVILLGDGPALRAVRVK